jgi:hypothetical protein
MLRELLRRYLSNRNPLNCENVVELRGFEPLAFPAEMALICGDRSLVLLCVRLAAWGYASVCYAT